MALAGLRLTDRKIRLLKPKDKDYVLTDGGGLQIRVRTNGSVLFNFNYMQPVTKKRLNLGLGPYPEVSLSQARQEALKARELVERGIDPKQIRERKEEILRVAGDQTLLAVGSKWFELKREQVTPDYADDIWRSLENYVFPNLGAIAISEITAPAVINVLKPLEAKGSLETVKRISQRMNEIMVFAVNAGIVFSNPLAGIRSTFKKPRKKNLPTLPPEELPRLMRTVSTASIKQTTRLLIEWQLHTMTRPGEAATAAWVDIDLDRKVWTIPAERMKKRRPHSIPLTDQAISLLEIIRPYSGHREYVFPSDRDPRSHTNTQTANMALKRMGFGGELVSHGLRSIASTTLNEQAWDSELIEVALAHVDSNDVRSAYNRAEYIERRRPMMEWWSQHIVKASVEGLSAAYNTNL